MLDERWRELVGFPQYQVSDYGCVRRADTGRILKQQLTHQGRPVIYLRDSSGLCRLVTIHSAVLTAFVGQRPKGCDASHLNGNRADNRITNLCWESPSANHSRKLDHGTLVHGERHKCSKLKTRDVLDIRHRVSQGETQISLAKQYGVSAARVSKIIRGEGWPHIGA